MPYYHACPCCGLNLDPGERCDCKNETVRRVATDHTKGACYLNTQLIVSHEDIDVKQNWRQLTREEFDALQLPVKFTPYPAAPNVYGVVLNGVKYIARC